MSDDFGGLVRPLYAILKAKETFESSLAQYENNGEDYSAKLSETVFSELMSRYDVQDVDDIKKFIPEEYRQAFKIFEGLPWDKAIELASTVLTESPIGKTEQGQYRKTGDVLKDIFKYVVKSKLKSTIKDLW